MTRRNIPWILAGLAALFVVIAAVLPAFAQTIPGPTPPTIPIPQINVGVTPATKPSDVAFSLQILLLLTVLTLAPTLRASWSCSRSSVRLSGRSPIRPTRC
jgi:flagellar biosynthesis protein FliP